MNTLDIQALKAFMDSSVQEVFETMLSMNLSFMSQTPDFSGDGNRIVGSVGFAGQAVGMVSLHVTESFAKEIAADMLGMDPDEFESEEEIHDVIGEISNMIGGSLKSRLCDSGYLCDLSIPSITSGQDFSIESKGWVVKENVAFSFGTHAGLVEVFIKPGK